VTQGEAAPTYTYTVKGVDGDSSQLLSTQPTIRCDYTTSSAAGTYRITADGAVVSNSNYSSTINYVPGTLTVTAATTDTGDGNTGNNNTGNNNTGNNNSSSSDRDSDSSDSSSSSSNTSTTTTNTDGSRTTTTTDRTTGTVTETTTRTDGSSTAVATATDGTVTTTETTASGVTGTTVTDSTGAVTEVSATIPATVAANAAENGTAVTLPVEVRATSSAASATAIDISVGGNRTTKVEVPVSNVTSGTVAVIVNADGTETIVRTSTVTDGGVALTVSGDATVKIIDNSKSFSDISQGYWAEDNIAFVTSRELFQGTTASTFNATGSMSRQALMTVLARLDGQNVDSVADGMAWATAQGISDGTNPTGPISRQQLAMMLYRYAGSPAVIGDLASFPDAGSVAGYANAAMQWAVANGIIGGTTQGTLNPEGTATRAAVAAMVSRYVAAIA
jgi:hypothetical protein